MLFDSQLSTNMEVNKDSYFLTLKLYLLLKGYIVDSRKEAIYGISQFAGTRYENWEF